MSEESFRLAKNQIYPNGEKCLPGDDDTVDLLASKFDEIERLTTEVQALKDELQTLKSFSGNQAAAIMEIVALRREKEQAETHVKELEARYTIMTEAISLGITQMNLKHRYLNDAGLITIEKALSNLPKSVTKLMEVVAAAEAWEIADENVDPQTLEHNLVKAIRAYEETRK